MQNRRAAALERLEVLHQVRHFLIGQAQRILVVLGLHDLLQRRCRAAVEVGRVLPTPRSGVVRYILVALRDA
jgi:hypothetical protein